MPVDVRTIRGVELVKVGTWECSNGTFTITAADLESAVEAHRAGALPRVPVVKIGHHDPRFNNPRFDGGPALGRLDGLRVTDGGRTLVADFVDMPRPIAALFPRAWPNRSVEAVVDYEDETGRVWSFAVTGVALLGETGPAVDGLAAVGDLYGVDIAAAHRGRPVMIAATAFHPEDLDAQRRRAVQVAAARRRRTHRTTLGV